MCSPYTPPPLAGSGYVLTPPHVDGGGWGVGTSVHIGFLVKIPIFVFKVILIFEFVFIFEQEYCSVLRLRVFFFVKVIIIF